MTKESNSVIMTNYKIKKKHINESSKKQQNLWQQMKKQKKSLNLNLSKWFQLLLCVNFVFCY